MAKLSGKVCVVTGGAKGIGRSVVEALLAEGARVAILDRNAITLDATVAALGGAPEVLGVTLDVSDPEGVEAAFATVRQTLGPVDILVNNAGIMSYALIEDMSVELWDEMMAVNLRSMFLCSRCVISDMKAKGWGRIINISSQLAHKGASELAHYCASKAAVLGFTRAFAREVIKSGITVNAVSPGPTDTDLSRTNSQEWRARLIAEIPAGRYGETEEIAPSVVFLASDAASYFVGASLNPNGGDVMI